MNNQVVKIMSSVLNISETEVQNITYGEDSRWDSMKQFLLIVSLEEEFNIRIQDDEMFSLKNFQDITELISRKIY